MKINSVLWLDQVVDKPAFKHHVQSAAVEEALGNKPTFRFVEKGKRKGEDVFRSGITLKTSNSAADSARKK